jgi:hypothetical protein
VNDSATAEISATRRRILVASAPRHDGQIALLEFGALLRCSRALAPLGNEGLASLRHWFSSRLGRSVAIFVADGSRERPVLRLSRSIPSRLSWLRRDRYRRRNSDPVAGRDLTRILIGTRVAPVGRVREIQDPIIQSQIFTNAQILLTGFILDFKTLPR